ncbi:N-acetylmuramoyl-L-alanine amidase [Streptomyces sp. 2112.3]|uniref:peptidoglycan-binding protein n=1 Tax=Streptomyces sp. 2112.3 TaxID=1881023 RepID=UPI00089BA66F|nr:peptidoglycan-binding protein [Streptomyces sp. 2112.3]SEE50086.1 N-acetylmuramoyl-L-alanine amidase [Streptomyces sp. 2112.3]
MATPLTASKLIASLRDEGLVVHEVRDWREHNRNAKGPWGPVNGVMIHHTATQGTDSTVDLCYDGRSELPGPLCHGVIDKQGEVHLVGNGRANHAGLGDGDVLRAVIREDAELPPDDEADTDGNARFYGFECINLGDGKDPWPRAQQVAMEKAAAAVCRVHGWSERSVIGHLEWQPGKVDPRGVAMNDLRGRIKKRLAKPAEGAPEPQQPAWEPFPGRDFFRSGTHSPVITAMGKRLVAEDCGHYEIGPGPEWTEADRQSYAAWQRKLGFHGEDADGVPGQVSWERLRVPRT